MEASKLKVGDVVTLSLESDAMSVTHRGIYIASLGRVWKSGETVLITQEYLNDNIVLYANSYDKGQTDYVVTVSNIQIENIITTII